MYSKLCPKRCIDYVLPGSQLQLHNKFSRELSLYVLLFLMPQDHPLQHHKCFLKVSSLTGYNYKCVNYSSTNSLRNNFVDHGKCLVTAPLCGLSVSMVCPRVCSVASGFSCGMGLKTRKTKWLDLAEPLEQEDSHDLLCIFLESSDT